MKYSGMSVRAFLRGVKSGDIDLAGFYGKFFSRARELQKNYNFFVTISEKESFRDIKDVPKARLQGLPVSVKDCICTEGIQSSAGSRILEGYKPPFDATAVARLKGAGGVVVGKTQQDEFGFGTFSVNSGFGVPRNPLDPERSCGGSSGGAAGFARAMDFPHVALAESTGGSISCPASFCGVAGLTPTYGLVSRWGLIDYSNSMDKIGAVAKSVDDAGMLLETIQGFDTRDFTSLNTMKRSYSMLEGVEGMVLGIPKEYMAAASKEIQEEVWRAVKFLESQGARYREVSLPNTKYALAAYYVIASSEASTNLARYCGMRYGASPKIEGGMNEFFSGVRSRCFGREAKRRILLGTFARMAGQRGRFYLRAFKVRTLVIQDFERAFRRADALVAPTMPIAAPRLSEIEGMSPVEQYKMDVLTVGPNLAGIPQLSVPFGSLKGLPVGVHVLGDHLQERKILRVGKALEKGSRPVEMG